MGAWISLLSFVFFISQQMLDLTEYPVSYYRNPESMPSFFYLKTFRDMSEEEKDIIFQGHKKPDPSIFKKNSNSNTLQQVF